MSLYRLYAATRVLVFTIIATFGLGFSHVSIGADNTMTDGMTASASSMSAQCQTLCMSALPPKKRDELVGIENDDRDPDEYPLFGAAFSLALLPLAFIVKELLRLSSWRPPDLVLLSGHYADGL
jgi:hypothetical protein